MMRILCNSLEEPSRWFPLSLKQDFMDLHLPLPCSTWLILWNLHLPRFNPRNQLLVHKLPTILVWGRLGLEKIVCLRLEVRDSVPNKYIFYEYEEKNNHDHEFYSFSQKSNYASSWNHSFICKSVSEAQIYVRFYIMYLRVSAWNSCAPFQLVPSPQTPAQIPVNPILYKSPTFLHFIKWEERVVYFYATFPAIPMNSAWIAKDIDQNPTFFNRRIRAWLSTTSLANAS